MFEILMTDRAENVTNAVRINTFCKGGDHFQGLFQDYSCDFVFSEEISFVVEMDQTSARKSKMPHTLSFSKQIGVAPAFQRRLRSLSLF
jgi:hypothetical protein